MDRRTFLITTGGATMAAATGTVFAKPAVSGIDDLFESDNLQVLALARRVMEKCVLEKIRPPQEPLKQHWIIAGEPHYCGQWIWDTMFVVDLLSLLPDKKDLIRGVFQNYWDFQDRWNLDAPGYARDMITVAIKTAPQEIRRFSQIAILAWGVERVYQRNGDMDLVKQCLGPLERFHEWYWRERHLPCRLRPAAGIADKTVANALKHGLSEHYDSVSGKALGIPDYSMAATVATMMLDGLTRDHHLKTRSGLRGAGAHR